MSCRPLHSTNDEQRREWITYRRFSEFNDLHMTIRKRFPSLREFIHLPTKNVVNNTGTEVRAKRQKELNDYLVVSLAQRYFQILIDLSLI